MKKILSIILALTISIVSLVGCSNNDSKENGNEEKKVAKIIYGATDSYDTSTNYIAGAWITAGVVETLFTVDNDGKIVEVLADGYERIDDLTWKINLKEDVKFHDESELNADAVIFSLNRLVESEQMNYVDSFEKESDKTVIIKTKTPYAALLSKLAEYRAAIVSPSNDFKSSLIGTGPFKFDRTEKDIKTVVKKYDGYWGGEVKLDEIELLASEDDMSRVYMLYNKDVDASYLPVPVTEVENIKKKDFLKVDRNERVEQTVLLLNTDKGALKDVKVRQALSYAIDREQLVEKACENIGGIPSYQYLPQHSKWLNKDTTKTKYDKEKAIELLKEAGISDTDNDGTLEYDNKPFELSLMTYDYNLFKPSVEVIQAQLEEIGIKVNLEVTTWDVTDKKMQDGDYDINLDMAVFYEFANPHSLSDNFQSDSYVAKCTRYNKKEMDDLLQKAGAATTEEKRKEYYDKIQALALQDLPVMPLYFDVKYIAMDKNLQEFNTNPNMIMKVTKDTHFEK